MQTTPDGVTEDAALPAVVDDAAEPLPGTVAVLPEPPREAETEAEPEAEPEAETVAEPALAPEPVRPPGDAVALAVAVVLPLVGLVLTGVARTWLTVAMLTLAPAIVVVYGLGLTVVVRVLRRDSRMRRILHGVTTRYRVLAWLWALAFLAAGISPMLGGLDMPWAAQAGIVAASAIVVGLITGALWSAYLHDSNRPVEK
jgi:hypothetical protein